MTDSPIPTGWLRRSAVERDLLLALAVDGPLTGPECRDRAGLGTPKRQHKSTIYRGLRALVDAGLVDREPVDDRTDRYELTADGRALVEAVRAVVCDG